MKILLTNDDGYRASGINALHNALKDANYDVTVVAPELNSSGASHSIAVYDPISLTKVSDKMYYVTSTPADSVRLGLQEVFSIANKNLPDIIISGINLGSNIAEDVLYSGTVGAAREGLIHGIPSIAVSTNGPTFDNLDSAALVVLDMLKRISNNKNMLQNAFLWNVNIPNIPFHQMQGFETTKLGMRNKSHKLLDRQISPKGTTIFWQGESEGFDNAQLGTDIAVFLNQQKISVTPIKLLPTDYEQMPILDAVLS